MASYKDKLKADLDRWIQAGLVPVENRAAILASLPEARRLDAATALAVVGALLLGVAVIAFVAANWDATPKLVRFIIILAGFLSFACAGAWAAHKQRPLASNLLLLVAALVFAAAIGLTGQIFDIAGNPRAAAYGAGIAALALGMAGRATAAATAGLIFVAIGDFTDQHWFGDAHAEAPLMMFAAPLGAYLALRWSSTPLAHASALAIIYCLGWFTARFDADAASFLFLAIVLACLAATGRWQYLLERAHAGVFYGWFAAAALLFFAIAGYLPMFGASDSFFGQVTHRIAWLVASAGALALGRHDRHGLVTAGGVLSLIAAISAILADLGLDLLAAALVFLLCAVAALGAGLLLRRKAGP